jgi:nitrate/nitrite transport system substrate-binding protein
MERVMSTFDNPFDWRRRWRSGCACGRHPDQVEHDRDMAGSSTVLRSTMRTTSTVVCRCAPYSRRTPHAALKSVGADRAAALSQFFRSRR